MTLQDYFYSEVWGELTFIPTNDSPDKNCRHCLLNCDKCLQECFDAPCQTFERIDGQNGYYSIHQLPSSEGG